MHVRLAGWGTARDSLRLLGVIATVAIIVSLIVGAPQRLESAAASPVPRAVSSITGANWVAGDIISDALFYDSKAMTASEIQTFLNAKIGHCTNGNCLNVIHVAPSAQPAVYGSTTGNLICGPVAGGSMTVAAYIYDVQVACGLSAKVILATLQKEQGLVTSSGPSNSALTFAMGMDCPDSTGCSSSAGGLASQLYRGSRQLVTYKKNHFAKQPGVQSILYSPNACGSSSVNIVNYATAALYSYTPYQPNAAALANVTGVGNSCSSYGNRNFWYFYTTWFGSTHGASFGWIDSGPGILATDSTGVMQLWGGNGKGQWKAPSALGEADWANYTHVQGVGDFNGDGHRDIVGIDSSGSLWISPSDGLASLSPRTKLSDNWGAFTQVVAPGDFNGDGNPDLLAESSDGALTLFPGDGLGGFRPSTSAGSGWNMYNLLLAPGDFNGDGRPDLIGRDPAGGLWLYRGTGSGTVSTRVKIGSGWSIFDTIIPVGDFNGDGKADLLGRDASGYLRLYPGNGTGGFGVPKVVGSGFYPTTFPTIAGLGSLPRTSVSVQAGAGDLNYDGHRDILARDGGGALWLYPGAANAKFGRPVKLNGNFGAMTAIAGVDDFDRNGLADVLMRDAAGTVWSYPVNRSGAFGAPTQVATGWGDDTAVLGPGDLTSDRISDLLVRDANGLLIMYAGDGNGGLAAPKTVGNGWSSLTIVTPGDLDGDGDADLLAIFPDGTMKWYAGDGAGGWKSPVVVGSGWTMYDLVFSPGDFDGDGIPDLIGRDSEGRLWLYRGNGAGGWASRVQIGTGWQTFNWIG